mmetsp:Transcript_8148/g.30058  ORF Transcript_8148/g.30058 Transcript_8148/m.30058 type:complete len:366 (+) Transcript_8148:228-1325(+)
MSRPPKGILIYVEGGLGCATRASLASEEVHPGFALAARLGCCGLVSLSSPEDLAASTCAGPETEAPDNQSVRDIRCILADSPSDTSDVAGQAQVDFNHPVQSRPSELLDMFAPHRDMLSKPLGAEDDSTASAKPPPLPTALKVSLQSTSEHAVTAFSSLEPASKPRIVEQARHIDTSEEAHKTAVKVVESALQELGLTDRAASEETQKPPYDLVLLHFHSVTNLPVVDEVLQEVLLRQAEQVMSKLYLGLLVGVAADVTVPQDNVREAPAAACFGGRRLTPDLIGQVRPPQSHSRLGGVSIPTGSCGAARFAVLATIHLDGVRADHVEAFDLDEICAKGGHGTLRAEHVIQEVAFKLGRAPKYGA